jgi:hypothetical protein
MKGWITEWKDPNIREEQSEFTDSIIVAVEKDLLSALDPEYRLRINMEETAKRNMRVKTGILELYFVQPETLAQARIIARKLKEAAEAKGFLIKGTPPRFTAEVSADFKPQYNAAGKAYAKLSQASPGILLKQDSNPLRFYERKADPSGATRGTFNLLLTWTIATGYILDAGNLKKISTDPEIAALKCALTDN